MIDIPPPAASEADRPGPVRAPTNCRQKGALKSPKGPLLRGGSKRRQSEDGVMTNMSERDQLLSLLFDRSDKRVINIKFFRGNASNLTVDEMCQTARVVVEDTWAREGALADEPPIANPG